jgi:sec-independent protein translocase protein TatA
MPLAFNFGIWEILLLVLVILLIFGPKRLPEMGRSLGHGMREFKDSITGKGKSDEDEQAALTQAQVAPPPSTPPATPTHNQSEAERPVS